MSSDLASKPLAEIIATQSDKPLFKPYIGPYLTLLSPDFEDVYKTATVLNPTTQIIINYEIQNVSENFIAQAFYRKKGDMLWQVANEDKSLYPNNNDIDRDSIYSGSVNHITLRNLIPNTHYDYYVTGENNTISSQYQFKTPKHTKSEARFLVIGDMQDENSGQRWQEIAESISQNHIDDFDFIITVGDMAKDDMSEQGDRFYWWKLFFDKGQSLFSQKPILPSLGNHDTPTSLHANSNTNCGTTDEGVFPSYCSNADDSRSYRKYFNIHPNRKYPDYYKFTYGNSCFISLNTEISVFYGRFPQLDRSHIEQTQIDWLKENISKNKSCAWSFVFQHMPVIHASNGKEAEIDFSRPFASIFAHNIDWSISGHTHQYQRMNPVVALSENIEIKNTYGMNMGQGVGYIITAPAGQWPRNNSIDKQSLVAFYAHNKQLIGANEIGYTIINVKNNKFNLKTYGLGNVGDQTQPRGYRENNDRSLKLLDTLSYSK